MIFNLFKCRHKRTYEVTTELDDGSFVVNTYCRKCEECVRVDTRDYHVSRYGAKEIKVEIDTNPRTNPNAQERKRVEKLRHQGMLLQSAHLTQAQIKRLKKTIEKLTKKRNKKVNTLKLELMSTRQELDQYKRKYYKLSHIFFIIKLNKTIKSIKH